MLQRKGMMDMYRLSSDWQRNYAVEEKNLFKLNNILSQLSDALENS